MKMLAGTLLMGTALALLLAQVEEHASRPTAPDPETTHLISSVEGANLFHAYCAVCHGADGRGAGPMALSLKRAPSDLTRIAARNHGDFPAAQVERIISGEDPVAAGHGTREMPVWGPIFSQIAWDQDLGRLRVHNLSQYLKRIQEQ